MKRYRKIKYWLNEFDEARIVVENDLKNLQEIRCIVCNTKIPWSGRGKMRKYCDDCRRRNLAKYQLNYYRKNRGRILMRRRQLYRINKARKYYFL